MLGVILSVSAVFWGPRRFAERFDEGKDDVGPALLDLYNIVRTKSAAYEQPLLTWTMHRYARRQNPSLLLRGGCLYLGKLASQPNKFGGFKH